MSPALVAGLRYPETRAVRDAELVNRRLRDRLEEAPDPQARVAKSNPTTATRTINAWRE